MFFIDLKNEVTDNNQNISICFAIFLCKKSKPKTFQPCIWYNRVQWLLRIYSVPI